MHQWSNAQIQPPDFTPQLEPCGLQLRHHSYLCLYVYCFGRVKYSFAEQEDSDDPDPWSTDGQYNLPVPPWTPMGTGLHT
jgi:hypothetical protein